MGALLGMQVRRSASLPPTPAARRRTQDRGWGGGGWGRGWPCRTGSRESCSLAACTHLHLVLRGSRWTSNLSQLADRLTWPAETTSALRLRERRRHGLWQRVGSRGHPAQWPMRACCMGTMLGTAGLASDLCTRDHFFPKMLEENRQSPGMGAQRDSVVVGWVPAQRASNTAPSGQQKAPCSTRSVQIFS